MDTKILCENCYKEIRDVFYPTWKYNRPAVRSYNKISNSDDSCPFCVLIRTGLRRAFLGRECPPSQGARVDNEICARYTTQGTEEIYINWGLSYMKEVAWHEEVRMKLKHRVSGEVLIVELGEMRCCYTINRSTKMITCGESDRDSENWQFDPKYLKVKTWFCDTLKEKTPVSLPNRVLDLEYGYDESLTADIRLVDETSRMNGNYIALSHRWSKCPKIQLTRETYQERLKNIPFASLPPLFGDAVKLCRQLGVRYLWIDALCIIQKDEEDWRVESGRMGRIYKDADCVIMAHFSKGDEDGFLDKAFCDCERILIKSTRENSTGLEFFLKPAMTARGSIDESPLSKRGWVFQERLLGTRVIHFAQWNVMMEVMGDLTGSEDQVIPQKQLKRLILGQEKASPHAFRQLWETLVESYSQCDLTNDKDKLPAVAGLAKILHSTRADQYFLSGLWSSGLWEQLLWISAHDSATQVKWRAPSWSWASLNGAIRFLQLDELIESETFLVKSFSSSHLDKEALWVDGPCVLAISGCVVEWDYDKIRGPHLTDDYKHVCIKQNSKFRDLVEEMGSLVQPLRSTAVSGKVNGWVSFDLKQSQQRKQRWWGAARGGAWLKALRNRQYKRALLPISLEESNREWISLTTRHQERRLETSDHNLPYEICVQICSYMPNQSENERKMNHIFLILQRVENTGDYRRTGIGEIFIDDFFSQIRGKGSEAKKLKFLGHNRSVTII